MADHDKNIHVHQEMNGDIPRCLDVQFRDDLTIHSHLGGNLILNIAQAQKPDVEPHRIAFLAISTLNEKQALHMNLETNTLREMAASFLMLANELDDKKGTH